MLLDNVYYNLKQIHSIDYTEGYIHISFKYKTKSVVSILASEDTYKKLYSRFKEENMGKIIKIFDLSENKQYTINVSTIVKMSVGIDKNNMKRLYMTECFGSQVGYALDDETINKVIKCFQK